MSKSGAGVLATLRDMAWRFLLGKIASDKAESAPRSSEAADQDQPIANALHAFIAESDIFIDENMHRRWLQFKSSRVERLFAEEENNEVLGRFSVVLQFVAPVFHLRNIFLACTLSNLPLVFIRLFCFIVWLVLPLFLANRRWQGLIQVYVLPTVISLLVTFATGASIPEMIAVILVMRGLVALSSRNYRRLSITIAIQEIIVLTFVYLSFRDKLFEYFLGATLSASFALILSYLLERECRINFLLRLRLVQSEAQWRSVIDSCPDGIVIQTTNGVVYANQAAFAISKHSESGSKDMFVDPLSDPPRSHLVSNSTIGNLIVTPPSEPISPTLPVETMMGDNDNGSGFVSTLRKRLSSVSSAILPGLSSYASGNGNKFSDSSDRERDDSRSPRNASASASSSNPVSRASVHVSSSLLYNSRIIQMPRDFLRLFRHHARALIRGSSSRIPPAELSLGSNDRERDERTADLWSRRRAMSSPTTTDPSVSSVHSPSSPSSSTHSSASDAHEIGPVSRSSSLVSGASSTLSYSKRNSNQGRSVELTGTRIRWWGEYAAVLLFRDITERKKMEAVEQSEQAKTTLLAVVSHEFRTPLNGILGMLQLLMDCKQTAEGLQYLRHAFTSGKLLLNLINDMLDFSKIEANKFDLTWLPFRVRRCVQEVIEIFAFVAHEKKIELSIHVADDVPDMVVGDARRTQQVLLNLIANALKFTRKGYIRASVSLLKTVERKHELLLKVEDTGIGIRQDNRDKLFSFFGKLHDTNNMNTMGAGLGLCICKQLSELMGGSIGFESNFGAGSTFWFTIIVGQNGTDEVLQSIQTVQSPMLNSRSRTGSPLLSPILPCRTPSPPSRSPVSGISQQARSRGVKQMATVLPGIVLPLSASSSSLPTSSAAVGSMPIRPPSGSAVASHAVPSLPSTFSRQFHANPATNNNNDNGSSDSTVTKTVPTSLQAVSSPDLSHSPITSSAPATQVSFSAASEPASTPLPTVTTPVFAPEHTHVHTQGSTNTPIGSTKVGSHAHTRAHTHASTAGSSISQQLSFCDSSSSSSPSAFSSSQVGSSADEVSSVAPCASSPAFGNTFDTPNPNPSPSPSGIPSTHNATSTSSKSCRSSISTASVSFSSVSSFAVNAVIASEMAGSTGSIVSTANDPLVSSSTPTPSASPLLVAVPIPTAETPPLLDEEPLSDNELSKIEMRRSMQAPASTNTSRSVSPLSEFGHFTEQIERAAPSGMGDVSPRSALRVLLVEDNDFNSMIAQTMLSKEGFHVVIALHGQEAVEIMEAAWAGPPEGAFDVILMDCQMPIMDGFEATRRVRKRERLSKLERTPILGLTALTSAEDKLQCLAAGMDDFLTKPVARNSLIAVTKKWALAKRRRTFETPNAAPSR